MEEFKGAWLYNMGKTEKRKQMELVSLISIQNLKTM